MADLSEQFSRARMNALANRRATPAGGSDAQRLVPVLQRFRIPLNAVAVLYDDLKQRAESAGAQIRRCTVDELAAKVAALPPGEGERVLDSLSKGLPARVEAGDKTVSFVLVKFPGGSVQQPPIPQVPAGNPLGNPQATMLRERMRVHQNIVAGAAWTRGVR